MSVKPQHKMDQLVGKLDISEVLDVGSGKQLCSVCCVFFLRKCWMVGTRAVICRVLTHFVCFVVGIVAKEMVPEADVCVWANS